jgi:hypothetical protein
MSEIKEIKIVPSRDVQDAKYVKYRGQDRKLKEYVSLLIGETTYVVPKKQISQLFRYLPVKITTVRGIRDYELRDENLLSALNECDRELLFSVVGDRVIRIVSSDFTAIPHGKVIQCIEKVLKMDYEDRKIEFNGGMFAKWTLRSLPSDCAKLGDIVSWQLWAYNYNIGNRALRIGGGFTVLKCQNGAIGWKQAAKVRLIHRGAYEDLLSRLHEAIDLIVNNTLPAVAYQIQEAQKVKAAKELIDKLLHLYPQWIQAELEKQLRQAHTVWDVSNAFSFVATHCPVTEFQRRKLSNHAVEVLQLAEVR